jgi:hypothetical protein
LPHARFVIANKDEAAGGERVDGNPIRPATIRESPRAVPMAGRAGYGNRPDLTRAVPEMLNDLAHIVAEELHLRPCEGCLKGTSLL